MAPYSGSISDDPFSMSPVVEREMSANQRGLIDTCFEEGQYETGICVLDSLRSRETKPAATHIRQLLYIALYPTPDAEMGKKAAPDANLPVSPSKLGAKQQRSALIPTEAASHAAVQLLEAFTSTNSPDALFRALPSFAAGPAQTALGNSHEDEDSFIARQSRCIRDAKYCWEMLREGFVKRNTDAETSLPNGRKRKHEARGVMSSEDDGDDGEFDQPSPVASHAWPVLRWLLSLLEKDESTGEGNVRPHYSSFLLSQIPPPRSGTDKRWDAGTAIEIVICCLDQDDPLRRDLGIRLLALLVNLTFTGLLDLPAFLTASFNKLQTLSKPGLTFLLTMFPQSPLSLQFKLAFCKHILVGTCKTPAKVRPRPQTRARPVRSRPNGSTSDQLAGDESQYTSRSDSISPGSAQRYPSICPADVSGLLETSTDVNPKNAVAVLRVQYEFVLTFATIQSQVDEGARDAEWSQMLSSGELAEVIQRVFIYSGRAQSEEAKDVDMMRQVLLSITQSS